MEPFQLVPFEDYSQIQDLCKRDWPKYITGYTALKYQIEKPIIRERCPFKVYAAEGNPEFGVIALSQKGILEEAIIIYCNDDDKKLEEALVTTTLIDWNKVICIPYCITPFVRLIRRLQARMGLLIKENPTFKHYLEKKFAYQNIECPPGTYTGPVSLDNIDQVDKNWPHRYEGSKEFFKMLIRSDLSYGLYSSEDNSLLCWMFINELGFLTHLFTEEKHRGKGYAKFVVQWVSNEVIKKGSDVFCFILEKNEASMTLFRSLDYDVVGRGVWIFLSKGSLNRLTY